MGRKAKPVEIKTCPKCGAEHTKPRSKYCSAKCGNSRIWTPLQKLAKSIAKRKAIMADTDKAEEERNRILKNKKIPPTIPSPYARRLEMHEESDGEVLWNNPYPGFDWEDYYGWK